MKNLTCIMCPIGCQITVDVAADGSMTVTGNTCKRGEIYAKQEVTSPQRVVTALFPLAGGGVVPCKTKGTVPKDRIFDVLKEIQAHKATAPVSVGQVLIDNVLGLGVEIAATADR